MMQTFTRSEAGGHAVNEDAFAIRPLPDDGLLCVIADGQGGRAGGARAATLACQVCLNAAAANVPKNLLLPGNWLRMLEATDKAILADVEAGFTTLVAFGIQHGFICGGSSGDSAALVVHADGSYLVLTEQQHKNPPVGSGAADFTLFSVPLAPPWKVLAMTDGVWKYAGWETVTKSACKQEGAAVIEAIHQAALSQRSKTLQDDFTLIVIQNDTA